MAQREEEPETDQQTDDDADTTTTAATTATAGTTATTDTAEAGAPTPPLAISAAPTPVATATETRVRSIPRSTVRDTWGWLWKDTAGRVLPFVLVSLAYDWWRRRQGGGHAFITRDWLRDALAGVVLGIPMAALAAVFRGWIAPGYRLPTAADQVVQSTFYLAMNAPGEEMFWRATVQDAVELGAGRVPRLARHRGLLAWLVATAGYGLYHRLGNWSWRSIAGVSLAGMAFGGLYHWRRNIVLPTILHGFATAGFLSWGDVYLHRRAVRRLVGQVGKRRAR